ncbi:MAG: alginate export family protein [Deltaproteobacteria bacterium]|nr:alginate export family protein [Deltaproteobacteria bacterium]
MLKSMTGALLLALAPTTALAQGVTANPGPLAPPPPPELAAKPRPDEPKPWRASDVAGLSWLRFGLEHRARYEHLAPDFRKDATGDAAGLMLRTSVWAQARWKAVVVGAELLDSRAFVTEETQLSPSVVDPIELLQASVALRGSGLVTEGDDASLTAGRMTLDVGSRRLVARNEFRNTLNAFTGVDAQWTSPSGDHLRTFVAVPVVRTPTDDQGLREARVEYDQENPNALFWGMLFESRPLAADLRLELYALGLRELDSDDVPTANRRLLTPGMRLFRPPTRGHFDGQLELMAQFGTSRASSKLEDVRDLHHFASSVHASLGYRFGARLEPRIALSYDHATGDASPSDDQNNRFDPLFGARRFDFGPTGLYGAVARSNVRTPGLRLEVRPHARVDAFVSHRAIWLASETDAWTTAGLRDATGKSGSFVGQQLEGRVRWHVFPRNLALEIGGAALFRGRFAETVAGHKDASSLYGYAQLTVTL